MDSKLGVQHHNGGVSKPPVHHHGGGRKGGGRQSNKGIKVVYISSPMMLTASAEEFRAIVQELTGRDSNVADHDLAHAPSSSSNNSWSSSSSSSYSSIGRASPTPALPQTMATATTGPGRPAEYAGGMAAPPPFQGMYDQAGSLLYGQDYW